MSDLTEKNVEKKPMTDEERRKLCEKLDSELDEFINSLPKRKYEDGWPEDRWEEEMAKHPFFMKEAPKPGDELHPLYEGLQQLKYSPDENEPHELAINYKDDGNFNFKYKNYRLAIVAYTEGIKQKCGDPEIESSLYNNRAACHWFLQNYRSCLQDCEFALKLKPDYEKPLFRAANCCFQVKKFEKAIEYCDRILEKHKENKDILELRKKSVQALKQKERDERKKEIEVKKIKKEEEKLIQEILKRGYKLETGSKGNINISSLEPCFPQLVDSRVHIDEETDSLVWPVVFVYPEYKLMDYIQQFSENDRFFDQLLSVFEEYPEWDRERKYRPENINVYFETPNQKIVKVDVNETLKNILKSDGFTIKAGTPSFILYVKDSEAEKMFLKQL